MGIGTLNESELHASLKEAVAEPGDRFEVPLDGYVVDIVRGDHLIEIQTVDFAAMGRKLDRLLDEYPVTIVHPVAAITWLLSPDGTKRRSPRKGSIYSIFDELVRIPTLLDHPNLTVDLVLITEVHHRVHDPKKRRGRGGWRVARRQLGEVIEQVTFRTSEDLAALLPADLEEPFTTAHVAKAARIKRDQAQRLCYCLKALGSILEIGRTRDGVHYIRG